MERRHRHGGHARRSRANAAATTASDGGDIGEEADARLHQVRERSARGSASLPFLPRLGGPATSEDDGAVVSASTTQNAIQDDEDAGVHDGTRWGNAHAVNAPLEPSGDSLQRRDQPPKWIQKYQQEARGELVHQDINDVMVRLEEFTLPSRVRKPLHLTLLARHPAAATFAGLSDDHVNMQEPAPTRKESRATYPVSAMVPGEGVARLRHQATNLVVQRRVQSLDATHKQQQRNAARITPTRFLFDGTRWPRSSRCVFCLLAGGELECATCDVVAHAPCYLAAYENMPRKTKGAFIAPTRFSWLCHDCQSCLQNEYDDGAKKARYEYIANQKSVFGKVVKAYVRMTRDAQMFRRKKEAVVTIQAVVRGQLARRRYNRMQRMRLKPYEIDSIKLHGFRPQLFENGISINGAGVSSTTDDLRLSNGFSCNPYVYVTVVDGDDDDNQLFCFETSIRKGISVAGNEIHWTEKLFVPGVNGNVTFCFTLLSKNGPNNFVLGQAVLALSDSKVAWRTGISADLPVTTDLEIFPRTAQRQPLRLADTTAYASARDNSTLLPVDPDPVFSNGSSAVLALSVNVNPYSDVQSYCGYMRTKNSLESIQTTQRWCVLANGVLRIYRHYGVILAAEIVDMSQTIEIKLMETRNVHREEQWIAMEHMTRLYLFQCERRAATKQWYKKLQGAVRSSPSTPSAST